MRQLSRWDFHFLHGRLIDGDDDDNDDDGNNDDKIDDELV